MPPYTATSPMNRFLSAGRGEVVTTGGGGMPKNQGWHTVTDPETTPEHVFQVKGELGSEAPQVMAHRADEPAERRHRQQSCDRRLASNVRPHLAERSSHPGNKAHPAKHAPPRSLDQSARPRTMICYASDPSEGPPARHEQLRALLGPDLFVRAAGSHRRFARPVGQGDHPTEAAQGSATAMTRSTTGSFASA